MGMGAAALVAGLALRVWFIVHAAQIDGDTLIYGDIAKNWMLHGVYGYVQTAAGSVPTLIRLPGYPLFLLLCFRVFGVDHYTAVMGVQAVADLATCVLAAALARRRFGGKGGMATLWLGALCPFMANYVASPLTETLSLLCVALAFYGLERWREAGARWNRWVWVTGFALAYAVLLRPEQGLLAAAVVPAMLWLAWKKNGAEGRMAALAPVAAAALCVVLPLAPWTVRNWRTFHVFEPLAPRYATDPGEPAPLGFQRWFRTWAIDYASSEDVYWNYDGAPIEIGNLPSRAFDTEEQYVQTEQLLEEYNQNFNPTAERDARFEALAEERIKADPLRYYVALPVARVVNMFLRPRTELMGVELEWWKWSEDHAQTAFATAYAGLNLGYFVLGGVGFWVWRRRGFGGEVVLGWAMMGFVVLRCALLLTVDNSEPRYTLEFFPVIVVWAAVVFSQGEGVRDVSESRLEA